MSEGHPRAEEYPVRVVWQESEIVVDRINARHATEASLLLGAIDSALNDEARKAFVKTLRELTR